MKLTNKTSSICPVCHKKQKGLVTKFDELKDKPLFASIRQDVPKWQPELGICYRCLNRHHQNCLRILKQEREARSGKFEMLPIPLLLNANPKFAGKGVRICFIDSGIYYHPDLMLPQSRIVFVKDITSPSRKKEWFGKAHDSSWHGMMTATVCAGNGQLSQGYYRGVACESEIVMLKVMDEKGEISERHIVKALEWVLKNHEEYKIRIINLSITDDFPDSYKTSPVDHLIKRLFDKGIVIVAAMGNSPEAGIKPPANAPQVLAIGGLDQHNTLDPLQETLYHSTYGMTIDGLLKPDLIAPSIWLAAPILPQTPEQKEAAALFRIIDSAPEFVKKCLEEEIENTELPKYLLYEKSQKILEIVSNYAEEHQYISAHYKEVDGTSFAAPIVSSVIAQMLEANPDLTPEMVREMLLSSARPLCGVSAVQQGYGVLHAAGAVALASGKFEQVWKRSSPFVDRKNGMINFHFYRQHAKQVVILGDFNSWSIEGAIPLKNEGDDLWKIAIPVLPKGIYQYKYLVDAKEWFSDPANAYRYPDGYDGFNSLLFID